MFEGRGLRILLHPVVMRAMTSKNTAAKAIPVPTVATETPSKLRKLNDYF